MKQKQNQTETIKALEACGGDRFSYLSLVTDRAPSVPIPKRLWDGACNLA